jgi:hypothetical protein
MSVKEINQQINRRLDKMMLAHEQREAETRKVLETGTEEKKAEIPNAIGKSLNR